MLVGGQEGVLDIISRRKSRQDRFNKKLENKILTASSSFDNN